MSGTPSWSPEEFERLLTTASWSRATLARRLPGRTQEELTRLRAAIHAYHTVDNDTGLAPWMVDRLAARRQRIVCAVCGARF